MQGESFRNILRIPPGNWGSPVQATLQEASFGSCFVVVVGLKMDQEPWKCRVGAQPGCRAGAEPPGLRELQDLPIPSTPDPAWRALSAHRVLQQQPWPWHPNGNPALKASSATKQGQNVVFLHFGNHVERNPVLVPRVLCTDPSGKGAEGTGAPGGEGRGIFLLSLCACLALPFSA